MHIAATTAAEPVPIRTTRSIPLDQGEFGVMQGTTLTVTERAGELDDPALPCRQQLLAGEFRRGA